MANTFNNKAKRNSRKRMIKTLFELVQTQKVQDISISELCKLAKVNRTTFYNHYDNINKLAEDARSQIANDYARQFAGNTGGFTPENFLIMFQHFYDNQIIYNTYFRLNPSYTEMLGVYDRELAHRHYPSQNANLIRYHAEFFAAGITAIIKRWLAGGCQETPEEMVKVVLSEYKGRNITA